MLDVLRSAIKKGQLETIKQSLNSPSPVDQTILEKHGHELLMVAVSYNQPFITEYLLSFDSLQKKIADKGSTENENVLLLKAASLGHIKIVDLLLKFELVRSALRRDALKQEDGHKVLLEAILKGRQAVIYRLACMYQALGISLPTSSEFNIDLSPNESIDLPAYVKLYKEKLNAIYQMELKNYHEGIQAFIIQGPREIGRAYMGPSDYLQDKITTAQKP